MKGLFETVTGFNFFSKIDDSTDEISELYDYCVHHMMIQMCQNKTQMTINHKVLQITEQNTVDYMESIGFRLYRDFVKRKDWILAWPKNTFYIQHCNAGGCKTVFVYYETPPQYPMHTSYGRINLQNHYDVLERVLDYRVEQNTDFFKECCRCEKPAFCSDHSYSEPTRDANAWCFECQRRICNQCKHKPHLECATNYHYRLNLKTRQGFFELLMVHQRDQGHPICVIPTSIMRYIYTKYI